MLTCLDNFNTLRFTLSQIHCNNELLRFHLSPFKIYFAEVEVHSGYVISALTCLIPRHNMLGIKSLKHLKCHLMSQWCVERSEGENSKNRFLSWQDEVQLQLPAWIKAHFTLFVYSSKNTAAYSYYMQLQPDLSPFGFNNDIEKV